MITAIVGNVAQTMEQAHSKADFPTEQDALVYFWAMRRTIFPQRVWILRGQDGWINNDSTVGKEPPLRLRSAIEKAVHEDNEIALDGITTDEISRHGSP